MAANALPDLQTVGPCVVYIHLNDQSIESSNNKAHPVSYLGSTIKYEQISNMVSPYAYRTLLLFGAFFAIFGNQLSKQNAMQLHGHFAFSATCDGIGTVYEIVKNPSSTSASSYIARKLHHALTATVNSVASRQISKTYIAISDKPQELRYRAQYIAENLPDAIKKSYQSTKSSIIHEWRTARNPPKTPPVLGKTVCVWGVVGYKPDGTQIFGQDCWNPVVVEGVYIRDPLTFWGIARYIIRALKTYGPTIIRKIQASFGFAYAVISRILYASAFAAIDILQRSNRAYQYVLFLALAWWREDLSLSFLVETAIVDIPRAYSKSFWDICYFVSMIFPHARLVFETGYLVLKSVCLAGLLFASSAGHVAHRVERRMSEFPCARSLNAGICVEDDDWIVLVAMIFIFGILRMSYKLVTRSLSPLLRLFRHVLEYLNASKRETFRNDIDALWERYANTFAFKTPMPPSNLPGGTTDFNNTGVDYIPLVWWSRTILMMDFLKKILRLLCIHLIAIPLEWWRIWCKEHLLIRPIDIIGLAVFSLATRIMVSWRPNVSIPKLRLKTTPWIPTIRLPASYPSLRHSPIPPSYASTTSIAPRIYAADGIVCAINNGPKLGLAFRELATLCVFATLCVVLHWSIYGGKLSTSCPLAEEEENNVDNMLNNFDNVGSEASDDDIPLALAVMQQPIYLGAANHVYNTYPTHQQLHP